MYFKTLPFLNIYFTVTFAFLSSSVPVPPPTDSESTPTGAGPNQEVTDPRPPGSQGSTLSNQSSHTEPDLSVCNDHTTDQVNMVRQVLYKTKENVNMLIEIYRQVSGYFRFIIMQ